VNRIETLARDIDASKLARARQASMEEKMLDGPRLFRLSCQAMKAGIRMDHPKATEEELQKLLIKRIYKR
jgi:hypothetical protein